VFYAFPHLSRETLSRVVTTLGDKILAGFALSTGWPHATFKPIEASTIFSAPAFVPERKRGWGMGNGSPLLNWRCAAGHDFPSLVLLITDALSGPAS
jgi:hypothetical protein